MPVPIVDWRSHDRGTGYGVDPEVADAAGAELVAEQFAGTSVTDSRSLVCSATATRTRSSPMDGGISLAKRRSNRPTSDWLEISSTDCEVVIKIKSSAVNLRGR